jgi:orotidine-5'-phosphate decarboxylase
MFFRIKKGKNKLETFKEKYLASRKNKHSVLCVGLDPAVPQQRETNVISQEYLKRSNENDARLNFCLDIIENTNNFCCAYKPNQQYVASFNDKDHQTLTSAIKKTGSIAILDYKLNDIGSSIDSALYHIHKWGYDAVTFNPFLGNMKITVCKAHQKMDKLGIIVLVLTSNTESVRYQKEALIRNKPLYTVIAEDVVRYEADGCVVGATGHISDKEVNRVRGIVGEHVVFLVPGVGTQRGDPVKVIRSCGQNLLINVGRDIIYSKYPKEKANEYNALFNKIRKLQ